jgi:Tol biopolymer transport system component
MKSIYVLLITLSLTSCGTTKESVLFSSSVNGNSDIFIMDSNGENKTALTQTELEEWGPTWINENEISFLRQNGDSIFRIKLNLKTKKESKLKHPTNCILDDKNILYSPSKQYELYSCKNDIFIFNPNNNELKNITQNLNGEARYPSWSNDGNSLIFTSNHLGTNELFSYEIETEKALQLTDSDSNNERGELSPDRKLLAYSSDYFEKGNQDILIKNLETGEIKNISKSPGMELIARFSKNGKKLYYGTNKDGNWEIYSHDLSTGKETQLTMNKEFDGDPRVLK